MCIRDRSRPIPFPCGNSEDAVAACRAQDGCFCADSQMKEGDEVIVSVMEHHSNIVPWQLQASTYLYDFFFS